MYVEDPHWCVVTLTVMVGEDHWLPLYCGRISECLGCSIFLVFLLLLVVVLCIVGLVRSRFGGMQATVPAWCPAVCGIGPPVPLGVIVSLFRIWS